LRVIVLVVVIAALAGALLFVSLRSSARPSSQTATGKLRVGQAAPSFTATDLAGHRFSLSAARGHPVIVTFGASWCHPCNEEYPLLARAAQQYAGRLIVVSVMYQDLRADATRFLRKYHATWPAIDDKSNVISKAYQVHDLPQTFFITPSGVLQSREWGLTTQRALDVPLHRLLASG
jgi:cytochrome c biogenesis protein CcmG/thiol:disulfide interchange protein DsbE